MVVRNKEWVLKKHSEIIRFAVNGLGSLEWEDRDAAVEFLRLVPDLEPAKCKLIAFVTSKSICGADRCLSFLQLCSLFLLMLVEKQEKNSVLSSYFCKQWKKFVKKSARWRPTMTVTLFERTHCDFWMRSRWNQGPLLPQRWSEGSITVNQGNFFFSFINFGFVVMGSFKYVCVMW